MKQRKRIYVALLRRLTFKIDPLCRTSLDRPRSAKTIEMRGILTYDIAYKIYGAS
jgi:hypothetical protein